jgi:uncharacterized lipoprotein YddW (UPF0748 family)
MKKFILCLLIFSTISTFPQNQPKREFRGVWVATVTNLDWPSSPHLSVSQQKAELIAMMDRLKMAGANAVFFQIRTECDALYNSPFEPWSYWLTGQQGSAPNPLYDPLTMAIEEAHKRGMELHAWLNPYRVVKKVSGSGSYPATASHISNTQPGWVKQVDNYKFLDPGLPMVEDYIVKIFVDVVNRYDVDGIHMDDYFYPYPDPNPITHQDTATFRLYNRGFTNIGDWRRDNINKLVLILNDTISTLKPWVKWGVSPFGIWKPGVPPGVSGFDAFNNIYCDPIAWLQNQSVDYITPQLYWPFGGGQDYGLLMPWWADSTNANGRHLYTGQASYKAHLWNASEIPNQLRANRNNPKCQGVVYFQAKDFFNNPKGLIDSLIYDLYKTPALPNLMSWKENVPPNAPTNLRYDLDAATGEYVLRWNAPPPATDGDTARRYAVYRFASSPTINDLNNGNNLFGLIGGNSLSRKYANLLSTMGTYFVVTALDKNNNESGMSNIIQVTDVPPAPGLIDPPPNSETRDSVKFKWNGVGSAGGYHIQIALDNSFTNFFTQAPGIKDTFFIRKEFTAQTTYYWRVRSLGFGGAGEYSTVNSFKTGFPAAPELSEPVHGSTTNSLSPQLKWFNSFSAANYEVEMGTANPITVSNRLLDTVISADTFFVTPQLLPNKNYFWHIKAINQYGASVWSVTRGFKTTSLVSVEDLKGIPEEFQLNQNYPNPFNPATRISWQMPTDQYVKLEIFDMLGRETAILIDENREAGYHTIEFDASSYPSGVYIYRLKAGNFIETRKLVLQK